MKDFVIRQGATRPNLTRRLTDNPSEINGVKNVKFVMKSVDGITVERKADITGINNAEVTVDWNEGDTEYPRSYQAEFHVRYKDGELAKYPLDNDFIVNVK